MNCWFRSRNRLNSENGYRWNSGSSPVMHQGTIRKLSIILDFPRGIVFISTFFGLVVPADFVLSTDSTPPRNGLSTKTSAIHLNEIFMDIVS